VKRLCNRDEHAHAAQLIQLVHGLHAVPPFMNAALEFMSDVEAVLDAHTSLSVCIWHQKIGLFVLPKVGPLFICTPTVDQGVR
jgi:hypothetical protein